MAYTTRDDVLTNLQMDSSDVPEALTTKAINKAEAIIKTKLPGELLDAIDALGSVPDIISHLAEDMASYFVIRALYTADNPNRTEWADRYRECLETLEQIATGKQQVKEVGIQVERVSSSTKNYYPAFDEADETTWRIDDDKLDDLAERDD